MKKLLFWLAFLLFLMLFLLSCYCTRTTCGDVIVHHVTRYQFGSERYYETVVVPLGGWKAKTYNTKIFYHPGDTVKVSTLEKDEYFIERNSK